MVAPTVDLCANTPSRREVLAEDVKYNDEKYNNLPKRKIAWSFFLQAISFLFGFFEHQQLTYKVVDHDHRHRGYRLRPDP